MGFFHKYQILIVTIPSLIGIHYWWYNLQYNKKFVPEKERRISLYGLHLEKERFGEYEGKPRTPYAAEKKKE
jgi:hypothetical protein